MSHCGSENKKIKNTLLCDQQMKEKSETDVFLCGGRGKIFNPCRGLHVNSAVNYSIIVEDLLDACTNAAASASNQQIFYARAIDIKLSSGSLRF